MKLYGCKSDNRSYWDTRRTGQTRDHLRKLISFASVKLHNLISLISCIMRLRLTKFHKFHCFPLGFIINHLCCLMMGGELSHYFSIFYKLELEVGIVSLKTYTLDLLTSHLCYFFVCHANWGGSYTRDYLRKFTFKCEILHVIWTVALIAKSCSNGCFNLIWEKI